MAKYVVQFLEAWPHSRHRAQKWATREGVDRAGRG
eukprot:COSAG02_NODE_61572_length_268_cov_0.615385_1_plen_34_part_10